MNSVPPRSDDMESVSAVADAAARNDTDALQRLVEAGTPVNIRDSSTGLFPLAIACSSGHVEAAKVLLQSGAKIGNGDEEDVSQTALHAAARQSGTAVRTLLSIGTFNVNSRDRLGLTPLHDAACEGKSDAVRALLDAGATVSLDRYGKSPLHYAAESGFMDVISMLLTAAPVASSEVSVSSREPSQSSGTPTEPSASARDSLTNHTPSDEPAASRVVARHRDSAGAHGVGSASGSGLPLDVLAGGRPGHPGGHGRGHARGLATAPWAQRAALASGHPGPSSVSADDGDDDQDEYDEEEDEEGSSSGLMSEEEELEEEDADGAEEGGPVQHATVAGKADGQRVAVAGSSRRVHGGRQGLAHTSALPGSTERGVRPRTPQPSRQPPLPVHGTGQLVMPRAGAAGRKAEGDLPSLVSEAQALVSRAEAELGTFEAAVHDALDMRLDNDAFLEMAERALADTGGKLAGTLSALQKARKAAGREVGRAAASLASLPPIQALAEEVAAARRSHATPGLAPAAAAAPAAMRVEQLDEESDADGEEDRNMDVCAVCGDYGELLICECCPRAFHLQCLGLTHLPSDDPWYCGRCDEPLDEKLAVMMLEAARKKAEEAHRASLSDPVDADVGSRLVARRGRLVPEHRGHDAADGLAAEYGTDEEDGLYGDEAEGSLGPDGIAEGLEEEVVSAGDGEEGEAEADEHSTLEGEEGDSQGTLEVEPEPHMADPITLGHAVNSRDSTGRTPLFYAVLKGRLGALRALVASGADIHSLCDDGKGLLHTAALGGYVATITACIALGLDPNCRDSTGQTPLYCASEKGNVQAVRALISAGAEVNASDNGDNGVTPLRRAAACGHIAVIDALVSAGADVDWCSRTGNNALHDAAWNGRSDAVRALVQRGASLQARDNHNWTALHYAADHGRTEAIVALISLGAEVSAKTKDRWTPLRLAAKGGHVEAVRALLGSKAKFLVDDEEENYKQSPLHAAARLRDSNERHSTVNTLIAAGADLSSRDKEGWTPVHCAAANGHADTLHALIRAGADVDGVDNHGLSPLREAAAAGHTAAVAALLEAGSDVNAKCKQGYTPLHDASWQGRADAVQALLKHGADPRAKASDGRTALHCASQRGHVAVTELLLPLFTALEVTTHDREGWTPLHRAAQEGHTAVVEMLLKHGAQVNAVHMYSSTALHEAAAKGDVKTVSALLGAGGDVHLTDHLGYTPLHSAAGNVKKNGAVVLLLLVAGASVNHKAADGQTALHIAAKQGNFDAVDVLVRWGADAHARDQERRSPMDVSSGAQVKKLLRLLRSGASGGPSTVNGPLPSGGASGNVDLKTFLARQGDIIDVLAADAPCKVTGTSGKKGKKGGSASSNAMVPSPGSGTASADTSTIISYDLQEVLAATDFFAAKSAGKGIYGSLYDCTLRGMPVVVKRVQLDPDTLQSAQPVSLHAHITAEMNTSKAIAATIAAAAASAAVTGKTDAGVNGGVHPDIPALLQSVRHLIGFCSVTPSQGGGQHSRVLLALVYAVPKDAMLDNWAQLDRQAVEMEARSASEAAELAAQAAEAELLALTLEDEPAESGTVGKGGAKTGNKGSKGKVAKKDSKASADAAADAAARLAVAKAEQEAKAKAAAVAAAALATKPAATVQASKPSSNSLADAKAVSQPTATVKVPAGSVKVKQSKIGRTLTDRLEQVAVVPDSPSKNKAVKAAVDATRAAAITNAEHSKSGVAGTSSAHPKGGSTGSTSPPLPATAGAVVASRGSDSDTATHGTAGTSTSSVTASAVPPGTPTSRRGTASQTVQGKLASSSASVQAAIPAKPPSTPSRKTADQGIEQRAVVASVNITPPRALLKKDAAVPVVPVPVPAAGATGKAGKGKGKGGVSASVDGKAIKAAAPMTGKGQAAAPAATGAGPWNILPKGAPSHATAAAGVALQVPPPSVANGGTAGQARQPQNRGTARVATGMPSRSGATAAGRDAGAPYALSAESDAWAPAGPPMSGSGSTGAPGVSSSSFRASASIGSGLNASANDFMPRTAADGSGAGTLSPSRMSVRTMGSAGGPAAAPTNHGSGPMQHGSAVQQHVAPMANPASVATALAMQLLANSAGNASAPSAAAAALALGAAASGVQSSGGVPVFPFGSATFDPNLMAATVAAAAAAQAQALGVQAHVQAVSGQHHSLPSSAAGQGGFMGSQGMLLQALPGPAGVNDGSGAYSSGNGMVHYGSAPPNGPGSYGMHGSHMGGGGGHVSVGQGSTLQGMQVGLMQQGMRQGMQPVNTMPVPGLTGPMSQHSSHAPGGTGHGSSRTGAGHGQGVAHGHHLQQGHGAAASPQNGSGFDADQELDQLVTDIIAE